MRRLRRTSNLPYNRSTNLCRVARNPFELAVGSKAERRHVRVHFIGLEGNRAASLDPRVSLSPLRRLPEPDHQRGIGTKTRQLAVQEQAALQAIPIAEVDEPLRSPDSRDRPPYDIRIVRSCRRVPGPARERLDGHDVFQRAKREIQRQEPANGPRVAAPSPDRAIGHGTAGANGVAAATPFVEAKALTASTTSASRVKLG